MIPSSRTMTAFVMLWILGACGEPASESGRIVRPLRSPGEPAQVLIAYHTRSGNTQRLAEAVAEGARSVAGTTVTVRPLADVTPEDLAAAEGLVIGTPTYFGSLPGEAKTVLESWSLESGVDFTSKVGGAFATGGDTTGGKEHVVISLLLYMLTNRMILVGPLHDEGERGWGEPGASATTGRVSPGVQDAELESARKLGQRVADVAARLR